MKTVDLFSGCGGMSLGFERSGFEIVAAFDNWELANKVYSHNFSHKAQTLDLANVSAAIRIIKGYGPDVIIGGPPCQDFSIAGKRKEETRANLTVSFAKIISGVKPKFAVMENVYNIEKSDILVRAKKILKDAGYGLTSRIIDASFTGVPQKRRRYFLIAALEYPDEFFGGALDNNLSKKPMTVHDQFGDSLGIEHYYAHPRSYNRRAVFSIHEPSSTIRRVNRPIPESYLKHPADKVRVSKKVRPLTTEERAMIQSFPKNFKFLGSKSQQEHLIANAVPPKLAQYVAKHILAALKQSSLNGLESIRPRMVARA